MTNSSVLRKTTIVSPRVPDPVISQTLGVGDRAHSVCMWHAHKNNAPGIDLETEEIVSTHVGFDNTLVSCSELGDRFI